MDERLNYIEKSITILDRKTKSIYNKVVNLVKVKWQRQKGSKWMWEPECKMRERYLELFEVADFEDYV